MKRWWFAPPAMFQDVIGLRPLRDTCDMSKNDHDNTCSMKAIRFYDIKQCIQHEKEIIVVPEGWLHSTLNVAESVGIALVPGGHA